MKNVLISGGSGLIGSHLTPKLKEKGYGVSILSRKPLSTGNTTSYFWDPEKGKIDAAGTGRGRFYHTPGGPEHW